jgi:type II secretory pathway pseudopilin PulG
MKVARGLIVVLAWLMPLRAGANDATDPAAHVPDPFLRVGQAAPAGQISLQIAVRQFARQGGAGPSIWLVGAAHIGEDAYYERLQQFLDAQPLVLYEGIGQPRFMERLTGKEDDQELARRTRSAVGFTASMIEWYRLRFGAYPASLRALGQAVADHRPRHTRYLRRASRDAWGRPLAYSRDGDRYTVTSLGSDSRAGGRDHAGDIIHTGQAPAGVGTLPEPEGMQDTLARALDLQFQLDAINYDREHFVNCDLPLRVLEERVERPASGAAAANGPERNSPGARRELDRMIAMLQGTGLLSGVLRVGLNIVAISPRLQQYARVVLIEAMAAAGDHLDRLAQLTPAQRQAMRVLIEERNEAVIDTLRDVLAGQDPPESVAVFYGAAHMRDMEQRLREQLGYRPQDQFWLDAFTADVAQAGLDEAKLTALRQMLRRQLRLPDPQ